MNRAISRRFQIKFDRRVTVVSQVFIDPELFIELKFNPKLAFNLFRVFYHLSFNVEIVVLVTDTSRSLSPDHLLCNIPLIDIRRLILFL